MSALPASYVHSALLRARRKRRRVLPLLACASLLQLGVLFVLLAGLLMSNEDFAACTTDGLIIPPSAPGGATYLNLGAPCSPAATATVEEPAPVSAANTLLAPLAYEAQQRRAARAQSDPGYAARVDAALNQDRINFLVFGYGDTYEPPEPVHFKGSINIFSLDMRTQSVTTITLNHDIRAPEIERYAQSQTPTKIHMALPVGGFELMRSTVEDATGLSVDFQLTMDDGVIKRAVDEVFGTLTIDSPFEFDARPIYFENREYPERHFAAGPQSLDGLLSLQYIKAVMKGVYDSSKELTVRKQIVIQSMLKAARRNADSPAFWTSALAFAQRESERGSIGYDFDAPALVLDGLQRLVLAGAGATALPAMGQSIYIVDERSGDGGVEWVTGSQNPIMQRDLADGVYAGGNSFSVPKGDADPYAPDLVNHYWGSVRELIKQRLTDDE